MRSQVETEELIDDLEKILERLAHENRDPPWSCCACLQDVDKRGHSPSCIIHKALVEIEGWWD